MFDIGFQELVIIFVIALLLIGPNKLPEFSRKLAKWVVEIKRGINLARSQIEEEINRDIGLSETSAQPLPDDDDTNMAIIDTEGNVSREDSKLPLAGI